jgi:hypothetical protein
MTTPRASHTGGAGGVKLRIRVGHPEHGTYVLGTYWFVIGLCNWKPYGVWRPDKKWRGA